MRLLLSLIQTNGFRRRVLELTTRPHLLGLRYGAARIKIPTFGYMNCYHAMSMISEEITWTQRCEIIKT